jgi:hypothetical protein
MTDLLAPESYDVDFRGQYLQTTYFDTQNLALRKARQKKERYLTLRIRCYSPARGSGGSYPAETYALSVKTESQKFRMEIEAEVAELVRSGNTSLIQGLLPIDLVARLLELTRGEPLLSVVTVGAHRYAVEDEVNRLTLDTEVRTDTCKSLPIAVLEHKQAKTHGSPTPLMLLPGLRPLKLSKFLWATDWK